MLLACVLRVSVFGIFVQIKMVGMCMSSDKAASEVFESVWRRYESAVNSDDSVAYGLLFTVSAIRVVPNAHPEVGRESIVWSEKTDYETQMWRIQSKPVDVMQLSDGWIYGIASVHALVTNRKTLESISKHINAAWLLEKQSDGQWLISRHVLNVRA